jgi:NADH-quinone oxidoreductase subunit A
MALPAEESLMLAEYAGVLVILAVATLFTAGILLFHRLAAPRRRFDAKDDAFECGESRDASRRGRHAVKFHLVAILFVVLLVEALFFYLWGVVFSETGLAGLIAIGVFTLPLAVGLVYEWAKGALEW